MSERQLVTIRTIAELRPIPDADVIETAVVDGWEIVVKRGEFTVGAQCVFFEVDSFLPATDTRFAFLEKTKRVWNGKEGYRLKTIKLKKQLSQGLALPLTGFPELLQRRLPADADFAAILGVEKWEEDQYGFNPASGGAARLSTFPSFIRKTDQERVQNIYCKIDKDIPYEVTVKLDGSSITVYRKGDHVGVCSRNQELKTDEEGNAFVRAAKLSGLFDVVAAHRPGWNFAVQGELCGPGIQKNRANFKEPGIWIFDIFDIDKQRYLTARERWAEMRGLYDTLAKLNKAYELKFNEIPLILGSDVRPELQDLKELLAFAAAATTPTGEPAEGVVYKPLDGDHQTFKVISNEYLLKHGL